MAVKILVWVRWSVMDVAREWDPQHGLFRNVFSLRAIARSVNWEQSDPQDGTQPVPTRRSTINYCPTDHIVTLARFDPQHGPAWRWKVAEELAAERRSLGPCSDRAVAAACDFLRASQVDPTPGQEAAATQFLDLHTARRLVDAGDVRRGEIEARLLARHSPAELATLTGILARDDENLFRRLHVSLPSNYLVLGDTPTDADVSPSRIDLRSVVASGDRMPRHRHADLPTLLAEANRLHPRLPRPSGSTRSGIHVPAHRPSRPDSRSAGQRDDLDAIWTPCPYSHRASKRRF